MAEVKYNDLLFPYPQPFVGVSNTPVFVEGKNDHFEVTIDLAGQITGQSLSDLEEQKRYLITGLSTAFKTLEVGDKTYGFCQPVNLNFADSNLSTFLPYSVSFIAYEDLAHNGSTTLYTGVTNLSDNWSFQEQENRLVEATHSVSAQGQKISSSDPLSLAKSWVDNRVNAQFNNFSTLLSGGSGYLVARDENIDQFLGVYGITDTYRYSLAEEDIFASGLIQTETQISWTQNEGLQVSLNGSVQGGLTGYGHPVITTGAFSTEDAKYYAAKSLERSKSDFESGVYGAVFNAPRTYEYTIQEDTNSLDFSFNFNDPSDPRNDEVKHTYSAQINASKDSSLIEISVNGELVYNSSAKLFNTGAPETGARFAAVEAAFSGVDVGAIASQNFADFVDTVDGYTDLSGLGNNPVSATIDKNPFESSITYNYSYDNSFDFSTGKLKNPSITLTRNHPITVQTANPNISGGFAMYTGHETMPSIQIAANAQLQTGDAMSVASDFLSGIVDNYALKYSFGGSGIVVQDTINTGDGAISINKTIIFPQ